jgi:hypothetical protein
MQSDHKKQLITLTLITLRGVQFHNNIINYFVPDKAIEFGNHSHQIVPW